MLSIKQILVPIDFSLASWLALEQAADLAKKFGAAVDVLHVWELPALVTQDEVAPGTGLPPAIIDSVSEHASAALDRFLTEARARGIAIRNAGSIAGPAYRTIVEEAERGGFDLIVVGTHGRKNLSRIFLGSVAERVVRYAPCPVWVAREQTQR